MISAGQAYEPLATMQSVSRCDNVRWRSLVLIAASIVALTGCGDARERSTQASRFAGPAGPPPPAPKAVITTRTRGVIVSPDGFTDGFRSEGRAWRGCGKTVTVEHHGYDYYGVGASGKLDCKGAIAVISALAREVDRISKGATDCFPGYCDVGESMTVNGYQCHATDNGDVSISLFIVCKRGNRYAAANAADDE